MKKLLLFSLFVFTAGQSMAQCNELFISEYVEGSGNNKGVEIYNPTSSPISLSNYRIVRYSNGSTFGTDSLLLTGTIQPYDVWVVVNGQTTSTQTSPACDPALQAMADQLDGAYPAPTYMNGDDAIVLVKVSPYSRIDIFGKIGEDPGVSWTDVFPYTDAAGAYWTRDHSLRRKPSITGGVMTNPTAFNVTTQWDSLPENTWSGLGMHTCDCFTSISENGKNVKVSVFPNPAESDAKFIVSAAEAIEEIEVFNTIGQVVLKVKGVKNEKQLSVTTEGLRAGIYFVRSRFSNERTSVTKLNIK